MINFYLDKNIKGIMMVYYKKATTTRRNVGKSKVVGIKGLSKEENLLMGKML